MKKMMATILLLSSAATFANTNCFNQVVDAFSKENPRFNIQSVQFNGTIEANTSEPFYMGDIWNGTDKPLAIYTVESSFMVPFTHAVLVDENCVVNKVIEVGFGE